jgi:hypothetical protein
MPNAALSSALLSMLGQLAPSSRLSYEGSWLAVAIAGFAMLGGLFAIAVFGEWRARRRAASLRRAVEGKIGPLAAGECVLKGVIETDEPDGRAIAIELLQNGQNYNSKNGVGHTWTETARRVDARPFYLRLEDGRAVRVEPDQRVFVVDALDGTRRTEFNQRVRTAEVHRGDQVFVIGTLVEGYDPRAQLEGGYRGAKNKSLILRAPNRRSMLVSTEVPTERHVRREGFHGNWALVMGLAFLLVHGFGFGQFYMLAATGTTVMATVTDHSTQHHRTKNGGYRTYHLSARYENVSGHMVTVTDETSLNAYFSEQTAVGSRVPFVVASASSRLAQVGTQPGVSTLATILSGLAAAFLAMIYGITVSATRPWYEKKKVVEHGAGPIV